jgi:hypothetical protein
MKKTKADRYTEKEALDFHSDKKPWKDRNYIVKKYDD